MTTPAVLVTTERALKVPAVGSMSYDRRRPHLGSMTAAPFRHFCTSPEIIRLAVMLYVRFPLSLRNVEDWTCLEEVESSSVKDEVSPARTEEALHPGVPR